MKLSINNCAKINNANIIIDGITVIAGENNTGKSTVGKILFSVFNAMNNIDFKIIQERKREIYNVCRANLRNYGMSKEEKPLMFRTRDILLRRISGKIADLDVDEVTVENISDIINTVFKEIHLSESVSDFEYFNKIMDTITREVVDIFNIPEIVISREVLTRYFQNVFSGQINSLYQQEKKTVIGIEIKGKNIELDFDNNVCSRYDSPISIMHKAIYIDNPFILDSLDSLDSFAGLNMMNRFLKGLLTEESDRDVMDGIIESVMAKEKLEDIDALLGKIVVGNILEEKSDNYFLDDEDFQEPIAFNNLSTGLKSFVLIKMLLEKGIIRNKDVIILDEPEIHLHPEWQVAYGELIVLIQKHFDLTIVVATHSPYFVDALNLFSTKYETDMRVNYYLSSMKNNGVEMELVTDDIEKIYKKMASPIQVLDTLRYELNNR